ncbi:aquaporin-like protein [Phlyctochytrium arcticum]|nr:aquaporin-like protein [Phlyctochytrium arcticum]
MTELQKLTSPGGHTSVDMERRGLTGADPFPLDDDEVAPFDDLNDAPGKFSWNPVDWIREFQRDYSEFSWAMTEKRRVLLRAVFGEGLCTFLFLFIVEAVTVNNGRQEQPENLTLSAVATAFCSIALIYSFADVSGAHFNPAVTFATMVTGKVSLRKGTFSFKVLGLLVPKRLRPFFSGLAFISIQLVAAMFSVVALMIVFPGPHAGYSSIAASVVVDIDDSTHVARAFFMEVMLTFILVYVIFATAFDTVDTSNQVKVKPKKGANGVVAPVAKDESVGRYLTIYTTSGNTKAGFAPFAIGFTLGFLGLIGGTVSGGAFNPARAFGPALFSGHWDHHWVYWGGDFLGAALAGWAQHFFAHEAQQHSGASAKTKTGAADEVKNQETEDRERSAPM